MTDLPRRLAAAAPAWTRSADVVVVGSGVAGLSAALAAARTRAVLIVCKGALDEGATAWAQGGIAAALGPGDSPHLHAADTFAAGVGLCDDAAVQALVTEGPRRLRSLARRGAAFDRDAAGWALTREGGHRRSRVVHAGGDATGREVHRVLAAEVRAHPNVELLENTFALDAVLSASPAAVVGLTVAGADGSVGTIGARAVVVAAGGLGQLFPGTTNPPGATGDGTALGLRAGASVADLEFVQFHPTVFFKRGAGPGQRLLITEALRGEGAVLVDGRGARVMAGVHPLADLAPRDVVTKAMTRHMLRTGADHLLLDATGLGADLLERRFPTVVAGCRAAGVDPATEPIPVAPAAHYASGGLSTDLAGRTGVPGLLAVGEAAFVGVHGANRLASNSLLEGLVYGRRVGAALAAGLPPAGSERAELPPAAVVPARCRRQIVEVVGGAAGVLRTGAGLAAGARELAQLAAAAAADPPEAESRSAWESTNLLTVGTALVAAAARRTESRGCHWREDHPAASPSWLGHLSGTLDAQGDLAWDFAPASRAAA